MLLEKYIGHYLVIELINDFPKNNSLGLYFNKEEDNLYLVKLMDVDNIGIWVEWNYKEEIIADSEGNKLDKIYIEKIKHYFLVKWDYIENVRVVDNPELNDIRMGYE
ncbi:hypothetical protein [Neobacillus vireti]|uniref:Uncharacterized protein n=1 Tax=Neobacillus vireti LMG 21834 TaxID=1131730 RepID=A0AB94IFU4_9BACI|nr:hypothetical protein [Neobacillus vireti]ETI65982.1 hypothetical protein BAVI_24918 [Neobacillus vireti LMG 21834]KLT17512.1 hypothetical protein AA980_12905 [Neobacillus vireti]